MRLERSTGANRGTACCPSTKPAPPSGSAARRPLGIQRLRTKHGTVAVPMPGWDVRVLDEEGRPRQAGQMGDIACRLPLPPGAATTLWQAPDRYVESYLSRYPGYYLTGDAGFLDEDGYLSVMTRTDDVINVAGHRLSSGAIEEVIAGHPDVGECAVIGLDDALKGQVPLGLLVLKPQVTRGQLEVGQEVIRRVRDLMGAVVSLKQVVTVSRLPKTRSGKTLRATLSRMANCRPYDVPATIEDPSVLPEIDSILRSAGLGASQG
jgi:propionyl-CoA synthetase